ncbi:hypothetical protein IAR55_005927 [Kwoniella newhampshirensis]|uniref:ATP-dependent RNA helicase n=1 Tax=Kwoniella newhampshirensis TaxID=1651941 RepID=A0AAW0YK46_9TREE
MLGHSCKSARVLFQARAQAICTACRPVAICRIRNRSHPSIHTLGRAASVQPSPRPNTHHGLLRATSSASSDETETVSRWMNMGISKSLIDQLELRFPHIQHPTPAQRLFSLAVSSGNEVYLKDDMGRGKTLALAIAAVNLVLRDPSTTSQIVIIVPTPHLVHQVCDHLTKLTPSSSPSTDQPLFTLLRSMQTVTTSTKSSSLPMPSTPIIISTPKTMAEYDLTLPRLSHIFLDEPDTMTGQIPPRYTAGKNLIHHRINRHPPPIVDVMNRLLGIRTNHEGRLNFDRRRDDVMTIWISATMTREFKRFVKTRGWVRKEKGVVDLDFTDGASEKQVELRERLLGAVMTQTISEVDSTGSNAAASRVDGDKGEHEQSEPEHYALVVDSDTGDILPMEDGPPSPTMLKRTVTCFEENGQLSSYLLETLALLHATSPPPLGAYALALPPEGVSLDQLGKDLSKLGVSTSILTPEILQMGLPTITEEDAPPILLAQRSSLPGLHLNELHTIYLLSGLDCAGLSPKQKRSGGVVDRMRIYNLVSGRLGRLGTTQSDEVVGENQKVVSIVMAGSEEEKRLKDLFFDGLQRQHEEGGVQVKRELKVWDMGKLNRLVEDEVLTQE